MDHHPLHQRVCSSWESGGIQNSQGQLTSVSSSLGVTSYTSFNVMGRVLASTSQVGSYVYPFSYSYDLAGDVRTETYPTGRIITNYYDVAGRLNGVIGTANSQATTYTTGAAYWPHGAPYYMLYGNNVVPVYTYNNRLQMNQWYATIGNDGNHFLAYNALDWGGSNNNGNLNQQSQLYGNNVPGNQLNGISWNYSYDSLNRLSSAGDSGGWSRNFSYDNTGNMWVTSNNGVPLLGNTPTSNIFVANNQMNGQAYDGAGNQISVNGLTVSYDAENHPTVAYEPPALGGGSVSYWYDGLGERTLRALPTQEFVYAYDAFGQLAVKYGQGTTPVQEYVYFGSQLLATENSNNGAPCSTCYFVWDHLGSTRLVLDQYANVIARHDYLPFGEEIPAGYAGRSSQWGVSDSVDQKFTGQQRDSESGEDNFNARYFAAALGRFTSPDPMSAGAVLTDPQSWNGYAYVRNSPMTMVDPSGMVSLCNPKDPSAIVCVQNDPTPKSPTMDTSTLFDLNLRPCDAFNGCDGLNAVDPIEHHLIYTSKEAVAPSNVPQISQTACKAAAVAAGAAGGALVGGGVGGVVGGAAGAGGGTLVAPGVGTVGGGVVGAEAGATAGAWLGGVVGAGIGYVVGNIACSSSSGSGNYQPNQSHCDAQLETDLNVCRASKSQACYAQAYVRHDVCSRGLPVPPLNF